MLLAESRGHRATWPQQALLLWLVCHEDVLNALQQWCGPSCVSIQAFYVQQQHMRPDISRCQHQRPMSMLACLHEIWLDLASLTCHPSTKGAKRSSDMAKLHTTFAS